MNNIYCDVAGFQLDDPQLNAIIRPNIELFVLLSEQIDLIERSLRQQVLREKKTLTWCAQYPVSGWYWA